MVFISNPGGTLVMGMGAAVAYAQNPNGPAPGTRADKMEDRQDAQQLHQQILADQQRLQSDTQQFGRKNPQVRADRRQLRQDRQRMKRLRADRQHDQRIRNRWRD
jgi:uncharacterized protein involved in exopolysaccharide biosynthesis